MPNATTRSVSDDKAMPTSGSESENRHFLPEIAIWAALTIDPVASLSEGAREVPEAVEACKQLVSKQYVALVERYQPLYIPWAPYNTYLIRLLQQGHPPAVPEKFLEAPMSVPVLPTTQETHISGRAPLKSSEMLPWSDCFIAFSGDHLIRSPSIWPSEPPRWTIDQRENIRLGNSIMDDILTARAKRDLLQTDQEADCDEGDSIGRPPSRSAGSMLEAGRVFSASPTSSHATDKSGPYFSACSGSDRFDDDSVLDGEQTETGVDVMQGNIKEDQDEDRNADAHDDNASLNNVEDHSFWQGVYSEAMTTVRFTHDLSRVTELNDIADYFKEVQAIERIEKEAASSRALRLQNEMIRAQELHAAVGERDSIKHGFQATIQR
ncbi:hypothetical protein R3P38DRAFT_74777 [Favolaschia claudopus]|uniref:Uncharacterized protein n=1 Tax=Favolaschia claudopus TaxID=2862362 RepID=A0AAW0D6T6_9AGAR